MLPGVQALCRAVLMARTRRVARVAAAVARGRTRRRVSALRATFHNPTSLPQVPCSGYFLHSLSCWYTLHDAKVMPTTPFLSTHVGWRHATQTRLASTVLGRLSRAAAASGLHRRHLALRGLVGLMRAASAAWEARADAEDHAARYRLWSCLRGWRRAAEEQVSGPASP